MAQREMHAAAQVWDVVRVPFPYTDRPVRQNRPALVIASPQGHDAPVLLWVLMITSAQNRGWAGDVMLSDIAASGLPVASLVRCDKIATIDARDAEPIGHLASLDQRAVAVQLQRILAGCGISTL